MYKNTILLQYFTVNRLHGGVFMNLNNITKINKNLKHLYNKLSYGHHAEYYQVYPG